MLISLAEYAKQHGVSPVTVRQKAQRGTLPAQKIGRDWLVDSETPYIDTRVKSGNYKNWRKKKMTWLEFADEYDVDAVDKIGGARKRQMVNLLSEWLHSLKLSDRSERHISGYDLDSLSTFRKCHSAEDVEEFVNDILADYPEEED